MFGFTNTLLEVLKNEKPTHIGVAFDTLAPTARHINFENYKAHRQEMPEDIGISIPYIKKILKGTVVSDKMDKTVVVAVTRFVKHPKYKKYLKITKKFKAHNEDNTAKTGDLVSIMEGRPISKDKRFSVVQA